MDRDHAEIEARFERLADCPDADLAALGRFLLVELPAVVGEQVDTVDRITSGFLHENTQEEQSRRPTPRRPAKT